MPKKTLAGFSDLRKQYEQDSPHQYDLSNHKTLVRLAWQTARHRFPHGIRRELFSLRSALFGSRVVKLKCIFLFELCTQEVGARYSLRVGSCDFPVLFSHNLKNKSVLFLRAWGAGKDFTERRITVEKQTFRRGRSVFCSILSPGPQTPPN